MTTSNLRSLRLFFWRTDVKSEPVPQHGLPPDALMTRSVARERAVPRRLKINGVPVRKRSPERQAIDKALHPYLMAFVRGEALNVKPEHVELLHQHYPTLFDICKM